MVATFLTKGFLLLALGFSQQAIAACTQSVTAKQGDTCASIASQAGITVTDFLRSNPSVTSCSELVAGQSYCVKGTTDGGTPPQTSTPAGLVVSPDGSCGTGVTCAGSRYGDCCSAHGYCGSTTDYCGDGCQGAFGNCGSGSGEPSQSPGGSITITVTSIQTSVITSTVTQARATATVTQTQTSTLTQPRATTTTTTSVSISTSVSTRTVTVTSLVVDTITSIETSTRLVTSGVCATKTTTGKPTTTTPPEGRPTLPGTPSNCKNYDMIEKGDTCRDLADRNKLTLLQFYALNPSVSGTVLNLGFDCTPEFIDLVLSGLCQINCDALWEGYYVCVGR
ncbi:carbohydrate-binding module family 18 protein [Chaetomium tenue]|uniref:Carbohydrate-binding module family 18 protein n=1 Tax=Chaetomium tenue TaxID=1854479 RepID=A0ACB7PC70_9PEZI|nr:carbohydrate-binding module family 18 protein [Chaetomium globosum]